MRSLGVFSLAVRPRDAIAAAPQCCPNSDSSLLADAPPLAVTASLRGRSRANRLMSSIACTMAGPHGGSGIQFTACTDWQANRGDFAACAFTVLLTDRGITRPALIRPCPPFDLCL